MINSILKKEEKKAFTLIELMVVIVIIGIMATATTMSFTSIFEKSVYEVARNITSNISFLYDRAALNNIYIRIEFDFKENSYKVSASKDRVLLFGTKLDVSAGEIEKDEKEKKREEIIEEENKKKEDFDKILSDVQSEKDALNEDIMGENQNMFSSLPTLSAGSMKRFKKARFETITTDDDLNFDIKLKPNIRIHAVYTEYYEDYVTKNKAEVFIFPNNYIQRTIIVLEDIESEEFTSILIEPFSGESTIVDGKYSLSDEENEIEEDDF